MAEPSISQSNFVQTVSGRLFCIAMMQQNNPVTWAHLCLPHSFRFLRVPVNFISHFLIPYVVVRFFCMELILFCLNSLKRFNQYRKSMMFKIE